MTTTILILAAGGSSTELQADYPVCLTEVDGISLIEKITQNCSAISDANYVFAIRESDCIKFHLDRVIRLLIPLANIVRVPDSTAGSACTSLLAICQQNPNDSLLVISANELVDVNFSTIIQSYIVNKFDAATITFKSIHPRYSYVKLNQEGLVVEAAQQKPLSLHATAGVFWFRRLSDFSDGVKCMIKKEASVNEKFYVAPVFNELILKNKLIGVYPIDSSKYIPLKNEKQLNQYAHGRLT